MNRPALAALVSFSLCACGSGSDDSDHDQAIDAAQGQEAEARALAALSPCASVSQCGNLAFLQPDGNCPDWRYQPYSLVSATAGAASAAAAEQQVLAREARSLAPPSDIACVAVITPAPTLACVASTCRAAR